MTDEEMGEEYCNNEVPFDTTESGEKLYTENDLKHAYLAGLKAGRPKWHKVADGDLPKDSKAKLYLVNIYSDSQLKFEYAEYTPTVCLWNQEWKRFEILELTVGSRIVNIRSVIAWKEIVLPETPKYWNLSTGENNINKESE